MLVAVAVMAVPTVVVMMVGTVVLVVVVLAAEVPAEVVVKDSPNKLQPGNWSICINGTL